MIMAATTNPAKAGILGAALLILFVLSACWISNARELTPTHLSGRETGMAYDSAPQTHRGGWSDGKVSTSEVVIEMNSCLCTLCEEFATEAVNFISENRTQAEIIKILQKSCSRLFTYKQLCIAMVDFYAPLLFAEAEALQPETFCQKVKLCKETPTSPPVSEDKCGICQYVLAEAESKLKDPDSRSEIIELLLKACDAVEGHVKKCKTLVFEYGPVIPANAEHFRGATDLCTMLRACDSSSSIATKQASSSMDG